MPGRNRDSLPLLELLTSAAREQGFPISGGVDLALAEMAPHIRKYDSWLDAGHAGAMEYLVRGRNRRADPRLLLPEAKSIFCVGWPYSAAFAGNPESRNGPRYSRYLRNGDYHAEIAARLERIMHQISSSHGKPLRWKLCTDTSAVLERSWAALAGLGWIGKNTLLIHPQYGSYFFLGEILLSEELGKGPAPLPDYCGNCSRCLQACPTGAFPEPHVLNSKKCISYLTLENRGALELADAEKTAMGTWVAGCDLCQEVCPFNSKPAKNPLPSEDGPIATDTWFDLLQESEEAYRTRVQGTALSRVKPHQFRRNLAVALANAILSSEEELQPGLLPMIEKRSREETDPVAASEWKRCLNAASQSPKRAATRPTGF